MKPSETMEPQKEEVLRLLGLEPLTTEGGLYTITYVSSRTYNNVAEEGSNKERALMSSIYYMLTDQYPVNYFHRNKPDIMHYYHIGLPIRYHMVSPEGDYKTAVMGSDITAGHHLQLLVPGGYWKAAELIIPENSESNSTYGLISEAVVPQFKFDEWSIATEPDIKDLVSPENYELLKKLIKS